MKPKRPWDEMADLAHDAGEGLVVLAASVEGALSLLVAKGIVTDEEVQDHLDTIARDYLREERTRWKKEIAEREARQRSQNSLVDAWKRLAERGGSITLIDPVTGEPGDVNPPAPGAWIRPRNKDN
jgi:predicted transcriptional regulator